MMTNISSENSPNSPQNHYSYISLAKKYIEEGREKEAQDLAVRRLRVACHDAEIWRGWGEIFEDLGMARQAKESYLSALRCNPEDEKTLFCLGALLFDLGNYEDSGHYLKKLLRKHPDHPEAKKKLAEIYSELGYVGQAMALDPHEARKTEEHGLRRFPVTASETDTCRLWSLFNGRNKGYGLQEFEERTKELIYRFIDSEINIEVLTAHLKGEKTIGFSFLSEDLMIRLTGFLVRIPGRIIAAQAKNKGYIGWLKEEGRNYLVGIWRRLRSYGIPSYLEDTGGYMIRLWVFLDAPVHFLKVKTVVCELMKEFPQVPEGKILLEPILPTRGEGLSWSEELQMLPLGINRGTCNRSFFYNENGEIYPNQLKYLEKIRRVPLGALKKAATGYRNKKVKTERTFLTENTPFKTLWDRCAVVRYIGEKSLSGKDLSSEEKVILFYSVGLLDQGEELLHWLLEPCPRYHAEKVSRQARRLKPHPVSCLKIRFWLPELVSSLPCNCAFDLRGGKYPSPLLHVNPHTVPASSDFEIIETLPLKELIKRYLKLRDNQVELERTCRKMEDLLEVRFQKKGIESFSLGDKVLRRMERDGKIVWQME